MDDGKRQSAGVTSTAAYERLIAAGLILPGPQPDPLSKLRIDKLAKDASPAIRAILEDREQD